MEDQTRFDLNRALLAWKAELAGEPGVSAENVRELQAHLLESIAALKSRGLNDLEAFLKARQQMGNMSKIGAEFAKDNPLRIWRDRVFWVAIAEFLLMVIGVAISAPTMRLVHRAREPWGEWGAMAVNTVLSLTPVFVVVLLLATGWIQLIYSRISWLFVSRGRLGIAGLLLIVVTVVTHLNYFGSFVPIVLFELGFLGFALVMMPREMLAAAHVKIEGATNWRSSIRLWRDRLFWIAAAQLAIKVWTMVVTVGSMEYIHSLPESKRSDPSLLSDIVFFSARLIPVVAVGVALSKARLSWVTRMLQSRSGILIAGSLFVLVHSCLIWWTYYRWHTPSLSLAEWMPLLLFSAVTEFIVQAALIAAMLWLLQRQQRMSAVEANA
jgi:hypothetical protein